MKISVQAKESYSTVLTREPLVLDTNDYPELKDLTEKEAREYILNHVFEMRSISGDYENLADELNNQDIKREKIYGEDFNFEFDND